MPATKKAAANRSSSNSNSPIASRDAPHTPRPRQRLSAPEWNAEEPSSDEERVEPISYFNSGSHVFFGMACSTYNFNMSFFFITALLCVTGVSASSLPLNKESNICNLEYYYCPRDPGCVTYDVRAVALTLASTLESA